MSKSKPVTAKAVASSIDPVPAGNVTGVVHVVAQDEIRHAYRQLLSQYHPDAGKAPAADIGFKERGTMSDE